MQPVIPLWVKSLLNHESPVINGDGSYSRDFTYIDNVIQANELAAITPSDEIRERLNNYFGSKKSKVPKSESQDEDGNTLRPSDLPTDYGSFQRSLRICHYTLSTF